MVLILERVLLDALWGSDYRLGYVNAGSRFFKHMKVFSPPWMNRSRKWVLWVCGGTLTALEEQEPEVSSLGEWRCSWSVIVNMVSVDLKQHGR